jgi:hypothetical protein
MTASSLRAGIGLVTAWIAAPGAGSGAVAGDGPTAPAPVFTVGDCWTYTGRRTPDLGNHEDRWQEWVQRVTPEGEIELSRGPEDGLVRARLDRYGNYIRRPLFSYEPSEGELQFPLAVGTSWRLERLERASESSPAVHVLGDVKVTGYGRVHTAAGDFDAFEIHTVGSMSFEDSPWHANLHATTWYAPQVRRLVKREGEATNGRNRTSWNVEISSYGHYEIHAETMTPEAAAAAVADVPGAGWAAWAASEAGAGGGAGLAPTGPIITRRHVGHC